MGTLETGDTPGPPPKVFRTSFSEISYLTLSYNCGRATWECLVFLLDEYKYRQGGFEWGFRCTRGIAGGLESFYDVLPGENQRRALDTSAGDYLTTNGG